MQIAFLLVQYARKKKKKRKWENPQAKVATTPAIQTKIEQPSRILAWRLALCRCH